MSDHKFSVLDMANSYASEQNMNVSEIFKKPKKEIIENETSQQEKIEPTELTPSIEKKPKGKWTPDLKLLEGMKEFNASPVTYSKDEFKETSDTTLSSIEDDMAIQEALDTMNDMERKHANIELAKKRFGIARLQIPPGEFQVMALVAASDPNYNEAKKGLDEYFNMLIKEHPEFVLEWADPSKNPANTNKIISIETPSFKDHTADIIELPPETESSIDLSAEAEREILQEKSTDSSDVKVIIDKSHLNSLTWTKEDMEKIKRARSIELNIKEDLDIKYSQVVDVDDENVIDNVLSQYHREVNDVPGALPASKYRATFTGLTYTEIMDLSFSQELNNLDGEKKKWSIAYDHIKNQSIGPWKEYKYYINDNKEKIILPINATNPANMKVTTVSKFEDFLMKTSFLDLDFILWKILCATAMEQEIVSIDCHGTYNGGPCNKSYDWIYSPASLIDINSMSVVVLEEMKKTSEVETREEIEENYKSSMLMTNNTIELPSSKLNIVFGHISAYDYLNHVCGEIKGIMNDEKAMLSDAFAKSTLQVLKYILIPQENGTFLRVKGYKNIEKIIHTLNEIDCETIAEVIRIMLTPYQIKFSLQDVYCPQCHSKSNITIEDMSRMLFIVARSLEKIQITLKKA